MVGQEIGAETTVEDILARHPNAATVFVARRMHCVGCEMARFDTVAEAASIHHQPVDELVAELRRLSAPPRKPRAAADTGR